MHLPPRSKGKIEVHSENSALARRVGLRALAFAHTAEAGGIVLLIAAIAALVWANSPFAETYEGIFHAPIEVKFGEFELAPPPELEESDAETSGGEEAPDESESAPTGVETESESDSSHGSDAGHHMTLHHWINDGLMVIFFFVVGLEIKRELVWGELAGVRRAALPAAIALGGMIVPAGIYAVLNSVGPDGDLGGTGIPMATDIAFALGVLAMLGNRVPNTLRVLLLAFAIVDDIGAIMVIAVFYTNNLSLFALLLSAILLLIVYFMQIVGVLDVGPYIFVGGLVWAAMLCSGVHATIAGVILGLMTPSSPWIDLRNYSKNLDSLQKRFDEALAAGDEELANELLGKIEKFTQGTESVLDRLVRLVHPWSSFVVLPIFAFANAGVALNADSLKAASGSIVMWGIFLGLLIGKPIGTTGIAWILARLGVVSLPEDATWPQIFGIGMLGGVGFTVALFITNLAFSGSSVLDSAKIGILFASLLAGIIGYLYLRALLKPSTPAPTASQAEVAS